MRVSPGWRRKCISSGWRKLSLSAGSPWNTPSGSWCLRERFWQVIPIFLSTNPFVTFQSEFIFSFLNIIDLLGILPFYVSVFLNLLSSKYSLEYIAKAAQIFRILRILRIFKLSRHITGLKTLGTTLKNSHRYCAHWGLRLDSFGQNKIALTHIFN